ncbi:VOC family protein [Couchioplanes caeruleus]|uniref:VOC domain-containing protein n=1 Tax=Couchioplanes caeruleus subsp. caeruleus TaxID=56427 RepID=A0A1K0G3L4_9ACTN|nr:VOC family protein [Couchioplanes caeruleus]OJF11882.1 hypothetical protein BG844_23775 [Couchioplanes caeruleus subsp. caeruleus]
MTVEEPAPTSQPSAESPDDDIDLPLDGDPEPPPETRPQARAAMATGIMAPPATDPPAQPLSTEPRAARILDTESRSKPMDDALLGDLEPPPWQQRAPETPSDPDAGESSAVQESPAPPRPRSGRTASPAASAPLSEQAASDPKAATGLAAAVAAGVTALSQAFRAKSSPKTPQRSPAASTPPIPEQRIEQQEAAPERVPRSSVPEQGQRRSPWSDLEDGFQPDDRADELITAYPSARPGSAGAIHGVGITVLVTHLDRSIAFYREMLGFLEIDTGTGSAVLASGDTRLVLRTVHDLSTVAGRHIHLNLEVGDVEAVYQGLKEKGVAFVHGPRPVNRGDKLELWAASFHDPDDHNIAITQWKAIR